MPKLPRISGRQAIAALERTGFVQIHQHGSDVLLKTSSPEGDTGCTVPLHRELAIGTLRGILRQARVSPAEFADNL